MIADEKRESKRNLKSSHIIQEDDVLYNHEDLHASHNSYDWLGNGIYFWENSLDRAEEWV